MVRDVANWVATYYPWHARIYGAYDFEPSWSSPWKAHHWMAGYDGTPGRPGLYANASADGCPTTTATGGVRQRLEPVVGVGMGWEFDSALPFPQVYATSGVNARQWQLVDLYATVHLGDGMYFYGTVSQWGLPAGGRLRRHRQHHPPGPRPAGVVAGHRRPHPPGRGRRDDRPQLELVIGPMP